MMNLSDVKIIVLILMALLVGEPYAQLPKSVEWDTEQQRKYPNGRRDEFYDIVEKIDEKKYAKDYDDFVVLCYDVCSLENPITEAMIADAKNGTLSEDRHFKCYLSCAFETMELLNQGNHTIDENQVWTQFTDRFDGLIDIIISKCLPISDTKDFCEMTYQYINCSIHVDRRAIDFIPVSTRIQIKNTTITSKYKEH